MSDHVRLFYVAGDDVKDVVRHVFLKVISQNVVRLEFVEDVWVTDDGEAIGAFGVGGLEKTPAGTAAGIVGVHVHLADDDLLLLLQLLTRQRSVLHHVAKHIDGDLRAGVRHVNVKNRAVERSERVHVAAGLLDFLVDAASGPGGGAFEEHVFEDVGEAGAQPLAFVDAPGHAPGLR